MMLFVRNFLVGRLFVVCFLHVGLAVFHLPEHRGDIVGDLLFLLRVVTTHVLEVSDGTIGFPDNVIV